ncbi:MAG: 16S rRNA (cytosine(1402)-N(4))-methyltransferase RsmH [Alphaproteobacteria bacterium]|nr:16S rRNA (cytosine(1402)-N(4))-methyltransferase RsmH [Alphaproteobacteria bacterium]
MTANHPSPSSPAWPGHAPVMLTEALTDLAPADGETYVDGTFGGGGYARAILEAADCTVWAIDRDPLAVARGARMAEDFGGRLTVLEGRFGDMDSLLRGRGIDAVDGIVLDLGVSSYQLDDPTRGFSFQAEGPLDMRMGAGGPSAADAVNALPEQELARIIYEYGEERLSRAIARAIVAARAEGAIETTQRLAEIVRRAVARRAGARRGGSRIDPATRTFQALRIHVNDELGELSRGLAAAETLLKPGGRLVVISFHSLEDRSVKSFFSARCGSRARPSRHQPSPSSRGTAREAAPTFSLLHRGMVKPSAAEITRNPRARSARMRAAIRTDAPLESAA